MKTRYWIMVLVLASGVGCQKQADSEESVLSSADFSDHAAVPESFFDESTAGEPDTVRGSTATAGGDSVRNVGDPATVVGAEGDPAADESEAVDQVEGNQPAVISRILGSDVVDSDGELLGHVRDFIFDFSSGNLTHAVVRLKSASANATETLVAVPLPTLEAQTGPATFRLRADKERLAKAPTFQQDEWPSAISQVWGAQSPQSDTGTDAASKKTESGEKARSAVETVPPVMLEERIVRQMRLDDELNILTDGIQVRVDGDFAILEGRVPTREARHRMAHAAAAAFPGPIVNRLEIAGFPITADQ